MKPSLINACLYGIVDLHYVGAPGVSRVTRAMLQGGVDVVQLRGKEKSVEELAAVAAQVHEITSQFSVPLIVNDHAQIAAQVPVEGVHVGQDDDSVAAAREKACRNLLVGKSTHSLGQATKAAEEGADYIGFGPIFATPTKPDYKPVGLKDIEQLHRQVDLPIFCIGGIKLENLSDVLAAGARRVAIVSGLLKAPDIAEYAHACKKLLLSETF